ncbi:TolC family protein [Chitinophaga sp. OAE865]|uniref:TolC family protein n=1 Tax=Chitinophaga sp. OAE865 TaxID=2817898 RepID=UPI001AE26D40
MNLCKSILNLSIITFISVQPVEAQLPDTAQVFTLEEIWKTVTAGNRQLKLSLLYVAESKISVLEAKDHLLPELHAGGDLKLNSKFLIYNNGLFSSPQNVPVSGYGYGVGYNFNVNLFNGGKDRRNIRIRQEEETRKQYEFDLQKSNVKYNAAVAYFDLYKFLHFRDFISTEISAEKKQIALIENLHKNGIAMKSDVLRTSVKLSQLELSLSDVQKKIDNIKQKLNILMGRNSEQLLDIPYQDSFSPDTAKDAGYGDYLDIALNQSPSYRIVNSDIRLSDLNIKQVKSTLLPSVSLYSNYNYTYPQISFYPYSNDLWGFGQTGVRVQFSIDNLYRSKHSIAHAKVIKEEAKEKAGIKKDEIAIQVNEAYLQQQQALESVATAEKNIAMSIETVRVIRNSYLNQESLLTDLLDAENELLEAKFNLTTAQVNVKLSHIRLLAITGIL